MIKKTTWSTELSGDVDMAVYEYCLKRNYKCKGCKLSIENFTKEHSKYTTCIFANCPCSWFENEED